MLALVHSRDMPLEVASPSEGIAAVLALVVAPNFVHSRDVMLEVYEMLDEKRKEKLFGYLLRVAVPD